MPDYKGRINFRHVGIVTRDIEKEREFYVSMGLHIQSDTTENVRIIKFQEGIELLQYESQSEANLRRLGISHVAFTVDSDGNPLEVVHALDK